MSNKPDVFNIPKPTPKPARTTKKTKRPTVKDTVSSEAKAAAIKEAKYRKEPPAAYQNFSGQIIESKANRRKRQFKKDVDEMRKARKK